MVKEDINIILGTAHVGSTPGKCSPDGLFREAEYSRERCASIAAKLHAYGYRVFTDYEPLEPRAEWTAARKALGWSKGEQPMELEYRVQCVNVICRQYGADKCLYVPVHVNGAGDGTKWRFAGGWCAYTSPGQTKGDRLADCLYEAAMDNLKEYFGVMSEGKLRGGYGDNQKPIRTDMSDGDKDMEANLYVLKNTLCAAALTENLYQDNRMDVAFLTSDIGVHAIERLHVEGILKYIKRYIIK